METEPRFRDKTLIYTSNASPTKVFKAFDLTRNEFVAIKEIVCEGSEEAESRLSEAGNQLHIYHPGLCRVWDAFIEENKAILVLEWMDHDLEEEINRRLKSKTEFASAEIEELVIRLVDALAYAESMNLCHRDLKPSNIFLTASGEAKIGDFGSAFLASESQSSFSIAGTPLFLSPLLRTAYAQYVSGDLQNSRIRHNPFKSDVFSLGLTLLYTIRKKVPTAIRCKVQTEIYEEIAKTAVPDWVKTVLQRMLTIDEEKRPSFLEVKQDVIHLAAERFVSYVNSEVNLQGNVWIPLIRMQMEALVEISGVQVRTTLGARCQNCGRGIMLQGLELVRTGVEAGYCSNACQPKKEIQVSASIQPRKQPKRIIRLIKKPAPEPELPSLPRLCVYCLRPGYLQDQSIPFTQCTKHMLCSPDCMQNYASHFDLSDICPICHQKGGFGFNLAEFRTGFDALKEESESVFALEVFRDGNERLEDTSFASESVRAIYEKIALSVGRSDFFPDISVFSISEMANFMQLFMPILRKLVSTGNFEGTCVEGQHVVPDELISSITRMVTGGFRTPASTITCPECHQTISLSEVAQAINRASRGFREFVCGVCGQADYLGMTECCGILACPRCVSIHHH